MSSSKIWNVCQVLTAQIQVAVLPEKTPFTPGNKYASTNKCNHELLQSIKLCIYRYHKNYGRLYTNITLHSSHSVVE